MKQTTFKSPEVSAIFAAYPKNIRVKLMLLRQLIFDIASETNEVGELEESLKWGQPSYLTVKPKSGTTIRIDQIKSQAGKYAMYFHCQTSLVETIKQLYPHKFSYQKNRAIIFSDNDQVPVKELSHCILLALTYHLKPSLSTKLDS